MKIIFFTWSLIFLTSCSGFKALQKAQENFSKAATIELKAQITPQNITLEDPNNWYQLAYTNIKKSLQNTASLEKDSLLGMTYSIKALCEWKLGLYEQAHKTRRAALKRIYRPNRNYALMTALPDLIHIDQTFESVQQIFLKTKSNNEDIIAFFGVHFNQKPFWPHIKKAMEEIPEEKATQIYLIQAQLAGLKNWSDALDGLKQHMDSTKNYPDTMRIIFAEQYQQYLEEKSLAIDYLREEESLREIFYYWNNLLL